MNQVNKHFNLFINLLFIDPTQIVTPPSFFNTLKFITKEISPSRAPIRIRFKIGTTALQASGGVIILNLGPEFTYDTNGKMSCMIRIYTTEDDFSQNEVKEVAPDTSNSQRITITPGIQLDQSQSIEVILEVSSDTSPHFAVPTSGSPLITASFKNGGMAIGEETYFVSLFKASPSLELRELRVLSLENIASNFIKIGVTAQEDLPAYPEVSIEAEFPLVLTTGLPRVFTCGMGSIKLRESSTSVRCILAGSTPLRIRFEGLGAIEQGKDFELYLYNVDNWLLTKDSYIKYFSAKLLVKENRKIKSQTKLTKFFKGKVATNPGTTNINFPPGTQMHYGGYSTISRKITWNEPCLILHLCRILVTSLKTWKFKPETKLYIDNVQQTISVDEFTNSLCKDFPSFNLINGLYSLPLINGPPNRNFLYI